MVPRTHETPGFIPEQERERQLLADDLMEFVQIPSPSGKEKLKSNHIRGRLEKMGFEVVQDEWGNLFTALDGTLGEPMLVTAHLDTVQKEGQNIKPYIDNGVVRAREGSPILGADNNSTIAVIFGALRGLQKVPILSKGNTAQM